MRKDTGLGPQRQTLRPLPIPSFPCFVFLRQQKYVDYMMREFQGKEEMRKSQYRLRFHLPMTIIPM